jgi:hypothetical protein
MENTYPVCEFCGEGFDAQRPNAGMVSRDYHFICFNRQGYLDGVSQKREMQQRGRELRGDRQEKNFCQA